MRSLRIATLIRDLLVDTQLMLIQYSFSHIKIYTSNNEIHGAYRFLLNISFICFFVHLFRHHMYQVHSGRRHISAITTTLVFLVHQCVPRVNCFSFFTPRSILSFNSIDYGNSFLCSYDKSSATFTVKRILDFNKLLQLEY